MKTVQKLLPWLILFVGTGLRVREYFANRSLWVDEAYLANNILSRSIADLLKPLTDSQHAPIGFLWAQKGISLVLGGSEYVLRIVPLLAGIVSLYLFWKLSRRIFSSWLSTFATALFSFSDVLIRYSVELKQYSLEVCVALISLLIFIPFPRSVTWKKGIYILVTGIAAIFCSHTAILIFGVAGMVGCVTYFSSKKWQEVGISVSWIGIWSIAFVLLYLRDVIQAYGNAFFVSEWPYMHLLPASLTDIGENVLGLETMFRELLGTPSAWIGLGFFMLGAIMFFKHKLTTAIVLIGPFILALIASGLEKYPYVTRVFLFATPMFIICMVESLRAIKSTVLVSCVALVLVGSSVVQAVSYTVLPREIEDTKPLLAYYQSHRNKEDVLYVYYATEAAFRYYAPRYALTDTPYHIGIESRPNWLRYIVDINQIRKDGRVWFLFSHVIITRIQDSERVNEEEYITSYLDKIGTRVYAEKRIGASLYLYDF